MITLAAFLLLPCIPLSPPAVLALWLWQARAPRAPWALGGTRRAGVALIAIQELLAGPLWWWLLFREPPPTLPRFAALLYVGAAAVLALLWRGVSLPQWLFPLSGRWLRGALAAAAALALLATGPWAYLLLALWYMTPALALVAGLDFLIYSATLCRWLAGDAPAPPREPESAPDEPEEPAPPPP